MIVTLIHHTDSTRSIQYGRQELAVSNGISWYTYKDIWQKEIDAIIEASTEKIQEILSKIF